jgi:hypothetical protein
MSNNTTWIPTIYVIFGKFNEINFKFFQLPTTYAPKT